AKDNQFESIDEVRLVQGAELDLLFGEDANLNGVLDRNENDADATPPSDNRDGRLDSGIFEYITVYSREGTLQSDGSAKINVAAGNQQAVQTVLQQELSASRATTIVSSVYAGGAQINSLLQFFDRSRMTAEEFAKVEKYLMVGDRPVEGLINVNTASEAVLACIPGIGLEKASTVAAYRQGNSDKLQTVAWLKDVLDQPGLIEAGPFVTTHSYQFTADICAVGHHGRGFQRVKFVIDTSEGTPQIRFRQDLSDLGWPLGQTVRTQLLARKEGR
ncbi:MAG TPA: hypothetical protein VK633_02495, partial [Verrucomicrobiae bacterium]|nr:hypothetical protein [Verrucomicrobiae bacterium]